jgi:hypothetical protein
MGTEVKALLAVSGQSIDMLVVNANTQSARCGMLSKVM